MWKVRRYSACACALVDWTRWRARDQAPGYPPPQWGRQVDIGGVEVEWTTRKTTKHKTSRRVHEELCECRWKGTRAERDTPPQPQTPPVDARSGSGVYAAYVPSEPQSASFNRDAVSGVFWEQPCELYLALTLPLPDSSPSARCRTLVSPFRPPKLGVRRRSGSSNARRVVRSSCRTHLLCPTHRSPISE